MKSTRTVLLSFICLAVVATLACQRDEPRDEAARPGAFLATDDGWITTRVEAQYFTDPDIRGREIDVTTSDRVVTLRGEVESQRERERAIEIARQTDGVAQVEDQLRLRGERPAATVGETAPADDRERGAGERMSSRWITTKIQAQYFTDRDVRARDIDVTTTNNVVTLTGEVDSEQTRQRAVEIARGTEGVREVEDRLRVVPEEAARPEPAERPGERPVAPAPAEPADEAPPEDAEPIDRPGAQPVEPADPVTDEEQPAPPRDEVELEEEAVPTDEQIATRIRSKFYQDDSLRGRDIDVSVSNRIVTLRGHVETEQQRQLAVNVAGRTEGVRDVQEDLEVRADPERPATPVEDREPAPDPADPERPAAPVEDREPAADPAEPEAAPEREDRELTERIEDGWITTRLQARYFLETDLRGRDIDVNTVDGMVTLSGQVRSEQERLQALTIAREADGVRKVVDRLTVRPEER